MDTCFFCRLIAGKEKAWIVYEDDHHIAFLTPFPNTPGFTVLVTREHQNSYVFDLHEDRFAEFLKTAQRLAHQLDSKLGTRRTGLIIEGMGIDHAHVKLVPMHGIAEGEWKPIWSSDAKYSDTYTGSISSHDGPRMRDEQLDEIQEKITS